MRRASHEAEGEGLGLARVDRAKVFYDAPRGFYESLADGKSFGEAWTRYFDVEWSAKGWDEVGGGIGRKRAYFWSVLGDWTLRLKSRLPSSGHSANRAHYVVGLT